MTSEIDAININASAANEVDDSLVMLMECLEAIDETKPASKLNAISMVDNTGSRIYF